jgi:hypothetical protein
MSYRATDDLQGYLKDAVLPRLKLMPKPELMSQQGYKSRRRTLTVRRRRRNLANIVFLGSAFDELVNDCRLAVNTKLRKLKPYNLQGSKSMCQIARSVCTMRTGKQASGSQYAPRIDSMFQNCCFLRHRISIGM